MLDFLKKVFGTKPTVSPCSDAPIKAETPKTEIGKVEEYPFPSPSYQTEAPAAKAKKQTKGKKPAVATKSVRKPRATKP